MKNKGEVVYSLFFWSLVSLRGFHFLLKFDFVLKYYHYSSNLERTQQHLRRVAMMGFEKHFPVEKLKQPAVLVQKVLHLVIMTWYLAR